MVAVPETINNEEGVSQRSFALPDRIDAPTGRELATRRAFEFLSNLNTILPDPDQILREEFDDAETVLQKLTFDDHVISTMQTRKGGTLEREWIWKAGQIGEADPTQDAKNLRDAIERDLPQDKMYNVVTQMLEAPFYGYVPSELMWFAQDGRIRIGEIIPKPRRYFIFNKRNEPRFIRNNNQQFGGNRDVGRRLPPGKFVFTTHERTYDNPYGLRLLSRCLWPVTFKKGGIEFWMLFTEKYGIPYLLGKIPDNEFAENYQKVLDMLVSMVQDAVGVVSENTNVELLESSGEKGAEGFRLLVDHMNASISKVILGETLTVEPGDRGARALGVVHENVLTSRESGDANMIRMTMNEIAEVYTIINTNGVAPPRFGYYKEEDIGLDLSGRDKNLMSAGVRFSEEYFVRNYGNIQRGDIISVEANDVPPGEPPDDPPDDGAGGNGGGE